MQHSLYWDLFNQNGMDFVTEKPRWLMKKDWFLEVESQLGKSFTPAFSVTCIGDIFVYLSTCHLSTCYLNGRLTVNRQFFISLAEEMTNR